MTTTEPSQRTPARTRWPAQQFFSAFGTRHLLRTDKSGMLGALIRELPHGCTLEESECGPPDHVFTVRFGNRCGALATFNWDGRNLGSCRDPKSLIERFRNLVVNGLCKTARDRVLIHAGVVAWQDRAVLIPARSTHGKSTLVRHFLEAGFTYYSDELAVLDSEGRVHPYARPLQLRLVRNSLVQTPFTAEELGAKATGSAPIRPALLICCRHREGARWDPRRLSPGAAALELTRHCTSARRFPQAAFHAISRAASRLEAWQGARGEAPEVVAWTLRVLDADGAHADPEGRIACERQVLNSI